MRNPNGYGGVVKLHGKRRKPFYVRVTDRWDIVDEATGEVLSSAENLATVSELPPNAKLKQIYKSIGSFKTRPEANIALAKYNEDPHSFNKSTVTFADIYERWSTRKFNHPKISKQSIASYKASYKSVEPLHDKIFKDLKKDHLQEVIDDCENGYESQCNIKLLYHQLYKYARENDITEKDYSEFVEVVAEKKRKSDRTIFDDSERSLLWEYVDKLEFVDTILIMIYSGLRPGELLDLKTASIDLEQRIMQGGLKTDAGKDRLIPINKKILPFIAKRKVEGHEFLINQDGKPMTYGIYYNRKWKEVMEQLQMAHRPQDCRHTFATMMAKAKADKLCIKRIMGHAVTDITESVYTHKDIVDLLAAIDLI